ncbi:MULTISPECIES: flagellar motor switch phosphatase FliY [Peribacillus]|uniref:flagellar motor switch phosphatase FliY n=1 Tax=Peribacillus TaxID=2675229 RepID=UPI001F4DEC7B|nr:MULTISPECIES: flagellar motor switch phosphatase FliY [unclassified Peribacillus]MCK1983911.1 flagellar motor switch phosphatase FliY [Peribacillus sp. Aquil_B1]MCK2008908.1 flagellar motor switch phosphatase FliY [Peribacillus sp. Aquil_B8]
MVSDGMLSQDEIDALLKGTSDIEDEVFPLSIDDYLSMMELDALGEIGNISFGSSATALSTLLNQKVDITTPTVTLIERGQIAEEFPHPYVAIQVQYTEGFSGINMLVIKQSDAAIIADLMLGGDGENPSDLLGEIQLSAVQEAMNQMMGSAATSMSTIFSKKVDISPPSIDLLNFLNGEGENAIPNEDLFAKISFRLRVGSLIDSSIMQLLPLEFAKGLVSELLNGTGESDPAEMKTQKILSEPVTNIPTQEPAPFQDSRSERSANETYGQGGHQTQPASQMPNVPQHFGVSSVPTGQPVNVQPASFTSFQPYQLQESETKNLSMLMDIPLQVTVELGRTKRSVKDILELSSGSIIELDKLAGEPVDILVNSRLIAKGEVVVIDENFGVRVTDIMSQSDRLNKIR